MNRNWQAFLRRFDIRLMFIRFFKQVLGWTRPKLRDAAAVRWTWIIIACYAQLCLVRHLAADIRLLW